MLIQSIPAPMSLALSLKTELLFEVVGLGCLVGINCLLAVLLAFVRLVRQRVS